jgi:hypothetical protein
MDRGYLHEIVRQLSLTGKFLASKKTIRDIMPDKIEIVIKVIFL